jgi:hypothetical protein
MKTFFVAFSILSSRNVRLAKKIDAEVIFLKDKFPYIYSTIYTIIKIIRNKPRNIILQTTQGPILFIFSILKKLLKYKLIGDVHSGFIIYLNIKGVALNKPFLKFLKDLDLIVLHNRQILSFLPFNIRKKCIVIYDPLFNFKEKINIKKGSNILIFSTIMLKPDEPLDVLMLAKNKLNDVAFICTGKKLNSKEIISLGYLKYEDYLKVMNSSDAVLAMTTREYTNLSILFEAISLEKCIIASHTKTLKYILQDSALFFKDADELIACINKLKNENVKHEYEIKIKSLKERLINIELNQIEILKRILDK